HDGGPRRGGHPRDRDRGPRRRRGRDHPGVVTRMSSFTAKDVQSLRQATGAGMMDAKKALTENDGDFDAAGKWLREKGLAKAATRTDRENEQGAVAVAEADGAVALVELKSETDFSAK